MGFSGLVQEAIDFYLEALENGGSTIEEAVSALGALNQKEADSLRESVASLRSRWR